MQNSEGLTPADVELQQALSGLRPATSSIDRDRMMFLAGQASARRGGRLWQSLAAMLALALGLSVLMQFQPSPQPGQVAVVDERAIVPAVEPAELEPFDWEGARAYASYVRLRNTVLVNGLDALPEPKTSAANGDDVQWIEEILGRPVQSNFDI